MKRMLVAAGAMALALMRSYAQTACPGSSISGTVHDSTMAVVAGAQVALDDARPLMSGGDGGFSLPCVSRGKHLVTVTMDGFAKREVPFAAPRAQPLDVVL